ncbi:helix-turn-helix domain-containing protein [Spirillospora sp. NBC_01491]|uniref:helix-turn-helix domain-containing protein n=1 Tax=Spirillospora sp. NBC_01491 TaxID=2976007 RepID=UPI002E33F692|nr:helix-turn-helix domain-containing protein [Spirillospora sp. NBC_01491]
MAATTTDRRGLARTAEAAEYLGRSVGTLANWRSAGTGPRFSGRGHGVRYRWADLDAWITENTHTGTR